MRIAALVATLLALACAACGGSANGASANAAPAAGADATPAQGDATPADADVPERWRYPRERDIDGNKMIVYEPQIRAWEKFATFEAQAAIEFHPKDGSAVRYGTVTLTGATEVDLDKRLVIVTQPKIDDVTFAGGGGDDHVAAIKGGIEHDRIEMPLDVFLLYLADDVLENPPPKGFNLDPPPIRVAETPTLLLFVNGKPVLSKVEDTGLELVVNANFPVFHDTASGTYYLIAGQQRLYAKELKGPWLKAQDLPAGFAKIDPKGEQGAVAAAIASTPSTDPAPAVYVAEKPTELIVIDGAPKIEAIPETDGLSYVTNTDSPLFVMNDTYYFLVSGRWFATKSLAKGPWKFVAELPENFQKIPEDHDAADVRASVPGTIEAKTAALEALLPTRKSVPADAKPSVDVTYAGEPKFEPIPGTEVSRAINSGYDVIQYKSNYYLCYQGVWYVSTSTVGPWAAAKVVPDAIYKIPPSSPSYPVTQVVVVESTPSTVVYEYPPSYSSSVYVVYGVPWYGTGWYYPPYCCGYPYYPYWGGSYGHGYWYSPVSGRYGSTSVWYGPYGGYSYSQGYNPRTGRYGYLETAWDGDTWKSRSETYNPRTGVSTETARNYNADKNKMKTNRTIEGPGGETMKVQRNTDFDAGTSDVTRKTSTGGSSSMHHEVTGPGTISSSGTITTAGGKTGTIEGEHQVGQGGKTTITGSEGGQMTTYRNNGNTTRVGESASGDVYAGRNGNVYRKTDDGWQHYDNGGWNDVTKPDSPGNGPPGAAQPKASDYSSQVNQARNNASTQPARPADYSQQLNQARSQGGYGSSYDRSGGADLNQLNRDYRARSSGASQYQQRRSYGGGGMSRPGGGFSRGGGGRRR